VKEALALIDVRLVDHIVGGDNAAPIAPAPMRPQRS
jgi:hypothetical protein